jgi:carboxypeptidase T
MRILIFSITFLSVFNYSFSQNYSRVKVFGTQEELSKLGNLGVTMDHGIRKEGLFFISDFSKHEIQTMEKFGYDYEILIPDVQAHYINILNNPDQNQSLKNVSCSGSSGGGSSTFSPTTPSNFNLGTMGGYLKYNEMLAELDAMAAQFPNLITVKAPISTFLTHENRPIYHVRISDNPNTNEAGEPKVLYTAIHHAREPMSLMETIYYMWYLLENYGTNDEVTYLVNNTQMYFVPCINPDGYVYNETTNPNGGGMWRKNRRNNGGGVYGVDLNRNYSYGWGTTGTSATPSNETYRGPSAFSEPETQAMRWLVQNNDFEMAFNAHTYAEDILFPIGTTTAEFAPHHDYFQDYTNHMTELNGYFAQKSSGLYPASGDSDDYMYKVDVGVGQKDTIFAHTPEVGTAFWQPSSEIIATCQEMVFPNLILAHLTRNYSVVKDIDGSTVATLTGTFNHSIKRLGRQGGNVTVSIEPLLNISSVGSGVNYNLNCQQTTSGAISYTLNPLIQFGDQIKYILKTDNGLWIKRDTIIKTYGAITVQAIEDATSATNWTGTWGTTGTTFVSPSKSFYENSSGNYPNNVNRTYMYVPTINLTNANAAMISFYAKWAIEADYDFVQFQVSTDGGTTWIGQCGNYTVTGTSANGSVQPNNQPVYEGTQSNWVLEEINLSDYLGQQIKVRFQLKSDGGTTADGFYFDDFKVAYNENQPAQPPVASFSSSSNQVCAGASVNFTDLSTNLPTTWSWDFGDNTTSTNQNPQHVYQDPGTYTVNLIVTNAQGSDNYSLTITVNSTPLLVLSSSDTDGVVCQNEGLVSISSQPVGAVLSASSAAALSQNNFDPNISGVGTFYIYGSFTDNNGCIGQDTILLIVEQCATLMEGQADEIKLAPNPSEGIVQIFGLKSNTGLLVKDLSGKIVMQKVNVANLDVMDLRELKNGCYIFEFILENNSLSRFQLILIE